jgi:CubicO group peptidase (beta-lactamase class C family)
MPNRGEKTCEHSYVHSVAIYVHFVFSHFSANQYMPALHRMLFAVVLLCTAACVVSDVTDLQSYYTYLRAQDSTIFAGSVLAMDTTGKLHTSSVVVGSGQFTTTVPMTESTSFGINAVSESYVATTIINLVSTGTLPFSLNEVIPAGYLPRGVSDFFNPNFPLVRMTMQMLMQHTSSIDASADFQAYTQTKSTGSVVTLAAFCEAFFVSTTTNTTKTSIWRPVQPGLASTYLYNPANVALLAFIANVAISSNSALVVSSNKTAAAYVQEVIFNPLGMSASFLLSTSGTAPVTSNPIQSPVFTGNAVVQPLTTSGASGDDGNTLVHPAYLADYMYYSTSSDLGKYVRSLFLAASGSTTTFSAVGTQMQSSTVSIAAVSGIPTGVTRQGLGIMYFDGGVMCAAAIASGVITSCPLTSSSTVYGNYGRGARSLVGYFCTTQASSTNPTCVVVQLSYFNIGASATKSYTYLLGYAAAAFQSAIGSSVINGPSPAATTTDSVYGVYVFIGVTAVFLFVMAASYTAEHIIQPAPIVATVPPHSLPIPQSYQQQYEENQKYYDDEVAPQHYGGGAGGFYDR